MKVYVTALNNAISIYPISSSILLTYLITSSSLEASKLIGIHLPPTFYIWFTKFYSLSLFLLANTKVNPSFAKRKAVKPPIPSPAPRINMTFEVFYYFIL